jgi:hypothetical protein
MAWHRKSVEKFLLDRGVEQQVVEAIQARIAEVGDDEGVFSSLDLEKVMGDPVLAKAYKLAWETDASLHMPCA